MSMTHHEATARVTPAALLNHYTTVRARSVALAAPLSAEDCGAQSMPDASPVKWHLAHTTWFFETFVLEPNTPGFVPFDPAFRVLFNSYYNGVGAKHPRPQRGLLTRPALAEVLAYRAHVDQRMQVLLAAGLGNIALAALIELGFKRAAELLAEEKIFDARGLPYATQLIPLAAICAHLGDKTTQHGTKQALLRWYWAGVMGELYGGANETRFAMDMQDVVAWIEGGAEPRTVRDANFAPARLLSLQSRLAAAYKGIAALLMKHGGRDFVSGTPIDLNSYFNNAIDIHHIFPRAWCEKQKEPALPREKWNSVINKAPLAAGTNRFLVAPSVYLARIHKAKQVDPASLDDFLASHIIPVPQLRGDDFDGFIRLRAIALLNLIEQATGKAVPGRDSEETVKAFGGALSA